MIAMWDDKRIIENSNYMIFVMGKSGVGKDTVKIIITEELEKKGHRVNQIQRYITRPLHKSENHIPVSIEEFEKELKENKFIIHWKIYNNYYGFKASDVLNSILNNEYIIMNISRELALSLNQKLSKAKFILVEAPNRLSIKRIQERNRETATMIDERIERMEQTFQLPADIITINNDGTLEDLRFKIIQIIKQIANED